VMTRTATTVWLDGTLLDDDQLRLHALTHALHYGSSVFEGIRVYSTPQGPAVFRLREHVDRLVTGAAAYGMELAWDANGLSDAIAATVRASGRQAAYLRPLAFFGRETVRLDPGPGCPVHVLIPVLPFFWLRGMTAVVAAAAVSLAAHFLVGASKSLFTLRTWWAAGAEMTVAGIIVGAVTFAFGLLFKIH